MVGDSNVAEAGRGKHISHQFDNRAQFYRSRTGWLDDEILQDRILARVPQEIEVCLDLGAGTGELTSAIQAQHSDALCLSVDISIGMVRQSVSRAVVGDAHDLPVRSSVADCIVMRSVLSYLHLSRGLSEVRRVLRPGGSLIVAEKVRDNFCGPGDDWLRQVEAARNPLKAPLLHSSQLATRLAESGFEVLPDWSCLVQRRHEQSLDSWLKAIPSTPSAREMVLNLLRSAPECVRDLGLSITGGCVTVPTAWLVGVVGVNRVKARTKHYEGAAWT
jgi:ubiquinone/menaquinone biosynthesis C-methylase UbiE